MIGVVKVGEKVYGRLEDNLHGKWNLPEGLDIAKPYIPSNSNEWRYLEIPESYRRDELGLPPTMVTLAKRPLLPMEQLKNAKYFAYVFQNETGEVVAFWSLKSRIVSKMFVGEGKISFHPEGFDISVIPDLVYMDRKLYFQNVRTAKQILPKLEGLLAAERKRLVREFLRTDIVSLPPNFEISDENLKRIPAATQQIESFSFEQKIQLKDYIQEVSGFEYDGYRYKVNHNSELRNMLDIIMELVFTTRITNQVRVARVSKPYNEKKK